MTSKKNGKSHRAPWECTFAKEERSQCHPGMVPKSDSEYFEILCLCILQAGLGWGTVRKNWARYKRGFIGFNINELAKTNAKDLLDNPDTIKNRRKISAMIYNAREFKKIELKYGSFSSFLNSMNRDSDEEPISKLTHYFHHIGNYSAEYFLHSVGFWK
ncbi:MAG: DNA-3-methyladenine glycosylase I [Thermoplasmata archaeon]|nr:MAG: DNA-3-methyladenine glycosylase I [Thermoplasmata archaeon]